LELCPIALRFSHLSVALQRLSNTLENAWKPLPKSEGLEGLLL